jgi:hypothetical protein
MKKLIVILIVLLSISSITFFFINQNAVLKSTTENIQVISKNSTSEEQWIVVSNGKKIFIEDFSVWALIKENQNYTIVYDLIKKSQRYKLRSIVPEDYDGQF